MKNTMMIIRLTILASVFSLAAASKAGKDVSEPTPPSTSKAGKSTPAPTYSMSYSMSTPSPSDSKSGKGTTPTGSKSSKSKSGEYFIAPFSCPQKCISAEPYELSSHLLVDGAVSECDASDSYQKWKVHQVGSLLKFESAAQHDHNMCLAVVHQDPDHETNDLGVLFPAYDNGGEILLELSAYIPTNVISITDGQIFLESSVLGLGGQNLFSEADVDGICSGKLGLAKCDHPGSYWYNTGGNLLSAFCWDHDTPTAMSVDETCTGMRVLNTTMTGDLTTSETFMLLGSN